MSQSNFAKALIAVGALALAGCSSVPPDATDGGHPHVDGGAPDSGQPDGGGPDAGPPDGGHSGSDGGEAVHVITAGGGSVKAAGSAHSVTLSVGESTSGVGAGPAHSVQLGILHGTQAQ